MKTGELIRQLRLKKGLTQEDLATKTDVSARTIQRIENSEVEARSFTLQSIAAALDVDFETLNKTDSTDLKEGTSNNTTWLPLLHLSGLFNLLLPPLLIWLVKRKNSEAMNEHGIAVINFQFSILFYNVAILLPTMFITSIIYVHVKPFLMILFLFSTGTVIMNVIKVVNGQPYKYPLSIQIIKSKL